MGAAAASPRDTYAYEKRGTEGAEIEKPMAWTEREWVNVSPLPSRGLGSVLLSSGSGAPPEDIFCALTA